MRFSVITIFPELFDKFLEFGIVGRAVKNGKVQVDLYNLRDFTKDKHQTVDDRPFGGGPGMVLMPEPLSLAIEHVLAKHTNTKVVFLCPTGKVLNQQKVEQEKDTQSILFICGRYEGIDARIIEKYVDETWSLGDFVLSGGELPAMAAIDSLARMQNGVLGNSEAVRMDSFSDGLLDYPNFTRPANFNGMQVPQVLLCGNHREIAAWREAQKKDFTKRKRKDLWLKYEKVEGK